MAGIDINTQKFRNSRKILFVSYVPFMSYIYNGLKDPFPKFNVISFEVWNKLGLISKTALTRKYDYIHSFWARNSGNDILSCRLTGTKFINHYIGSDVLRVQNGSDKVKRKAVYIHKRSFKTLAVSQHLIGELDQNNISDVRLLEPFYYEDTEIRKNISMPEEKTVLTYIPEGKEDFYGYDFILEAASAFSGHKFIVLGNSGTDLAKKENIHFKGWVDNVDGFIDECFVYIRNTKHDGLPNMVLKSLLKGRHVLYSQNFMHTNKITLNNLADILGSDRLNTEGRDYMLKNYSKDCFIKKFAELYE